MPMKALGSAAAVLCAAFVAATVQAAEALPDLGPAQPFALATAAGGRLALAELRGKVVLLAFIYTGCTDVCLTETAKMVTIQNRLGADFADKVHFLSVTMDPEADTGDALAAYARRFGARAQGWTFLTGTTDEVRRVARNYGVAFRKGSGTEVEHNTLASIIDAAGELRVQYMGVEFDPDEMLADLRGLVREGAGH
ncbi:MAG: SCO family protein [Rhodocyclaceae bacterium]|nr:SCO family protein [Rhodocyclaceae bacterium]